MNAADGVGYTLYGTAYCSAGCLPEGVGPDDEEVALMFAGSEWDSYPTCDTCRAAIEDVALVQYTCKNCGHVGPHVQDTGNPDTCIACHKAPRALREMLNKKRWANDTPAELHEVAFPGAYPILYVTKSSEVLCAECALKALRNDDDDPPVAYAIYEEGEPETCVSCGECIESAYGDPDAEDSDDQTTPPEPMSWLEAKGGMT